MRVTQAPLLIFFTPKMFHGELLFEEDMIFKNQMSIQQGDFDDFLNTAQNRTGHWASKKVHIQRNQNEPNAAVACKNCREDCFIFTNVQLFVCICRGQRYMYYQYSTQPLRVLYLLTK